MTGTVTSTSLHRRDDALGDHVAAHDAAEDVDEDRLHLVVRQNQLERLGHALRGRAAADVEEVRRLAAVQLDHVHRRHREARAVHHAGDVAVERDVVEIVLGGLRARVSSSCDGSRMAARSLLAEQRVVVDVDLGVERDQVAVLRHDQRIELDQRQVALENSLYSVRAMSLELGELLAGVSPSPKPSCAALVGLQARRGIDVDAQDLLGCRARHLLDVHAAGGRGDEGDALRLRSTQQRQVQLALDRGAGFDVHEVDGQTSRRRSGA